MLAITPRANTKKLKKYIIKDTTKKLKCYTRNNLFNAKSGINGEVEQNMRLIRYSNNSQVMETAKMPHH
jgi:hypothetical protein